MDVSLAIQRIRISLEVTHRSGTPFLQLPCLTRGFLFHNSPRRKDHAAPLLHKHTLLSNEGLCQGFLPAWAGLLKSGSDRGAIHMGAAVFSLPAPLASPQPAAGESSRFRSPW